MPTPHNKKRPRPKIGNTGRLSNYLNLKRKEAIARERQIDALALELQKISGSSVNLKLLSDIHKARVDKVSLKQMEQINAQTDPSLAHEQRAEIEEKEHLIMSRETKLAEQKQSLELLGPLGKRQLDLIIAIEKLLKEIHY